MGVMENPTEARFASSHVWLHARSWFVFYFSSDIPYQVQSVSSSSVSDKQSSLISSSGTIGMSVNPLSNKSMTSFS